MAAAPPVDELFAAKLSKLTGSKESIEDLSQWVQFHRRRIKQLVPIWFREVQKDDGKKVMLYFYLCNDVMQGSRKKGNECIQAFGKALPAALKSCIRHPEPKIVSGLQRLLKIWLEREIYPVSFINELMSILDSAAPMGSSRSNHQSSSRQCAPYVPHTAAARQIGLMYAELVVCENAEAALRKGQHQEEEQEDAVIRTLTTRKRLLMALQHEENHHSAVLQRTGDSTQLCNSQLKSLDSLQQDLQLSKRHRGEPQYGAY